MVNFVTENQERRLGKIFHGEEGVEFGFRFGETFVVFGVDEEDDPRHFREIVAPEAAGWYRKRVLVGDCPEVSKVAHMYLVDVLRDQKL